LRFDFAGEVSEENEETFRAETKRKRDRVCEMTAKKKQKKKMMMLKRGVSVSSSSSDDDDENAVKDEKNIERRISREGKKKLEAKCGNSRAHTKREKKASNVGCRPTRTTLRWKEEEENVCGCTTRRER